MELTFDPKDTIQHIGEALALIVTAIAQEHDAPLQLLDALQGAVRQCKAHPTMYSPVTRDLVQYAAQGLEGAIQGAMAANKPN